MLTPPHPALFDATAGPDRVVSIVDETVLRTWGRTHNQSGPKPPTFRRVRRVVSEEVIERWCTGCNSYVPVDQFAEGRVSCRPCRRRQESGYVTAERRERWKWRAHSQRARALGVDDDVTFEQWLAVIESTDGRCAAPDCDDDYEVMDHVVSYAAGGTHTPDNLQPLCDAHHREKTRSERSAVPDSWADEAVSETVGRETPPTTEGAGR